MSSLTHFITPNAGSQQLARARFRLLASKLTTVNLDGLSNEDTRQFARAWISAVEDTCSVRHLPPAWRAKLAEMADTPVGKHLVQGSLVAEILAHFESQLPDTDYSSVWIHLENSDRYLDRRNRFRKIVKDREKIAKRISLRVEKMYGQGDLMEADLDFVSIRNGIASFIQDWGQAEDSGPGAAELSALHAFNQHIIAGHEASVDAWQLLLQSFNTDQDLLGTGIEDLVEVLTEALPRFTTLQEFAKKAIRQNPALPENLRALAVIQILLTAAPQSRLAGQATGLLQYDQVAAAVKQGEAALKATPKGLRENLRIKLEQYQIDWWDGALAWFHQIAESEAVLTENSAAMKTQAGDAFRNTEDPRRLAGIAHELIYLTTRLGNGTIDVSLTAPVFRSILVQDYGCDPKTAPWSQAKALSEGAMQILQSLGTQSHLLPARTQIRKLEEIIDQIGQYSLSSARAAAGEGWTPAKHQRCKRDLGFMLQRVALEHRIARPATAQLAIMNWYEREIAVHLIKVRSKDLIENWHDLITNTTTTLNPKLLEAAERIDRTLPRITTALKLIRHHQALGLQAANHAMAHLPDYHKTVGEKGTSGCARDNALTLLQAGRILLTGSENPAEELAAWWNSVVQTYVINRPTRLFETNLQGLHATFLENLSPIEVDTIFPILHQVYKESLGIQDLPLLFFREVSDSDLNPVHAPVSRAVEALPSSSERTKWVKNACGMIDGAENGLPNELSSFLHEVGEAFASPSSNEQSWSQLRATQQTRLSKCGAKTLIRSLATLASEGTRRESAAGRDLVAFALQGIPLVVQDSLALQLESSWADTAGPRLAASATSGGGDEVAQDKCARDLKLLTDFLVRQLRTQSLETGTLNTLRFLVECVVPNVAYPAETWQEVFRDWQRSHVKKTDSLTRPIFDALCDLFFGIAPKLPTFRQLCASTFDAGNTVFSPDILIEKTMRNVFSTTLVHAAAPSGGLLNREGLRTNGFRRGATLHDTVETIFDGLDLHLDRQFDHLEGNIYYELQESLPKSRQAYFAALKTPAVHKADKAAVSKLNQAQINLNVFKKLGRLISGPQAEEMAADIWRTIMAVGFVVPQSTLTEAQSELLVKWLLQVAPEESALTFQQLSAKLSSSASSSDLPAAVRSFLNTTKTA